MGSRGRPRSFDREEALAQAMQVFWARGYEGATLTDLQKAMGGIVAPSFYAAFGSKEKLFFEALELYSKTLGLPMMRALEQGTTAREAIAALLQAAIAAFCKPNAPRGCMFVLDALSSAPTHRSMRDQLRELRARRRKLIEQRLRRGVDEGELPAKLDSTSLAWYFTAIIDGLSIQARDGASRQTLEGIARRTMAAWSALTKTNG